MAPESPKSFHKKIKDSNQLDIDFELAELLRNSKKEEKIPSEHEKLISMLQEFFKNKQKPGSFNIQEIFKNYIQARVEYFKEKEVKMKNPNYQGIGWEKIMTNHTPSIFTPKDWLSFIGKYREELKNIIEGH